jgi:hypothetical protein
MFNMFNRILTYKWELREKRHSITIATCMRVCLTPISIVRNTFFLIFAVGYLKFLQEKVTLVCKFKKQNSLNQ